jgi:hypothetical protein
MDKRGDFLVGNLGRLLLWVVGIVFVLIIIFVVIRGGINDIVEIITSRFF